MQALSELPLGIPWLEQLSSDCRRAVFGSDRPQPPRTDFEEARKKGNDKLAAEIDKALAELKKNGEYDKIYKTWFGEVKK